MVNKKIDIIKTEGKRVIHQQIRLMDGLVFMRLKSRRINDPSNIGVCNEEKTSKGAN